MQACGSGTKAAQVMERVMWVMQIGTGRRTMSVIPGISKYFPEMSSSVS